MDIRMLFPQLIRLQVSIPIPHISWTSNSGKRNPLQPISTDLKLKQRDVISQMMLPPLGFLYKG